MPRFKGPALYGGLYLSCTVPRAVQFLYYTLGCAVPALYVVLYSPCSIYAGLYSPCSIYAGLYRPCTIPRAAQGQKYT